MTNNNQQAFFALVRAGLWEKEVRLLPYGDIDYAEVMRLSQEQAVVGLVAAGLEHVTDVKVPQVWALQFAGQTIQLEQRNKAMNQFIADLVAKMREADIYSLLVKGQGIAQCYERPQWRSSGDVDLLLSVENFEKAKSLLLPLSSGNKPECNYSKELGYYIDSWSVELHGTQRTGLSSRVDTEIDAVQRDLFYGGKVRSWNNGGTTVFLPAADEDVFIIFTHFIKHFYKEGGVTVRQVCDWCRLLWTYKDSIDSKLLERRIKRAGLKSEWKAFGMLSVDFLGMPMEAVPLYSKDEKWSRKAEKIVDFILKGGEWRKVHDTITVGKIFPMSTLRFLPGIILNVNWLKIKERLFKA
jgi:hypothetical protein